MKEALRGSVEALSLIKRGSKRLCGERGSKRLCGERGSKRLCGERGSKSLCGERGSKRLCGERGSKRLCGERGSKRLCSDFDFLLFTLYSFFYSFDLNYSGMHTPGSGVFWPCRHNFRDIELKFCIFS